MCNQCFKEGKAGIKGDFHATFQNMKCDKYKDSELEQKNESLHNPGGKGTATEVVVSKPTQATSGQ